jgi:hypothetical protein
LQAVVTCLGFPQLLGFPGRFPALAIRLASLQDWQQAADPQSQEGEGTK